MVFASWRFDIIIMAQVGLGHEFDEFARREALFVKIRQIRVKFDFIPNSILF
jgi:hypothetical protein